jgi:hypothetical protein
MTVLGIFLLFAINMTVMDRPRRQGGTVDIQQERREQESQRGPRQALEGDQEGAWVK